MIRTCKQINKGQITQDSENIINQQEEDDNL